MGFKYEVYYWDIGLSRDVVFWQGEKKELAEQAMQELADNGRRCITLVWRPD